MFAWQLLCGRVATKEPVLSDEVVLKNAVSTGEVVVKHQLMSDGDVIEDQFSDADVVKDPLLFNGYVVKDSFFSGEDMVKEQLVLYSDDQLLSDVSVVENVSYYESDIGNDPLWSDGNVVRVTVPGGVQCTGVGNSVLCSLDAARSLVTGNMGLEDALSYESHEPAYCNFCIMYHSVTYKARCKRSGISEVVLAKDSGSCETECGVEHVMYLGSCNECAEEPCEDTGWKNQSRTWVSNEDSRCNWRGRRRSIVWWLLLLLLGAAPLVSGQLRPITDISTSRAEGGEFCVW